MCFNKKKMVSNEILLKNNNYNNNYNNNNINNNSNDNIIINNNNNNNKALNSERCITNSYNELSNNNKSNIDICNNNNNNNNHNNNINNRFLIKQQQNIFQQQAPIVRYYYQSKQQQQQPQQTQSPTQSSEQEDSRKSNKRLIITEKLPSTLNSPTPTTPTTTSDTSYSLKMETMLPHNDQHFQQRMRYQSSSTTSSGSASPMNISGVDEDRIREDVLKTMNFTDISLQDDDDDVNDDDEVDMEQYEREDNHNYDNDPNINIRVPDIDDKDGIDNELSEEDIEFVMANTGFSYEQITQWYSDFLVKCPDGLINQHQFCTYYKNLMSENLCDNSKTEISTRLFKLFDIDGDGYMNYAEFLVSFWIRCQAPIREKFTWLFNMYDKDKNGALDYNELKNALTCCLNIDDLDELLEQLNDERIHYYNKLSNEQSICLNDDDDEAFYDDNSNSAFSSKSNINHIDNGNSHAYSPTYYNHHPITYTTTSSTSSINSETRPHHYSIYSRTTKLLDDKLNELIIQLNIAANLMQKRTLSQLQQLQQNVNVKKIQIKRQDFLNLCVKYKHLRKLLIPIDYYYEYELIGLNN